MDPYQLTENEASRLQSISGQLFGKKHLLSVAVVLQETKEPMSQAELTRAVSVDNTSSFRKVLELLVQCGFVELASGGGGQGVMRYRCRPSPFWALVDALRNPNSLF